MDSKRQWFIVSAASLVGLIVGLSIKQEWGLLTTILTAIVSIFAGAIITRSISEKYYKKATEDLKSEASEIVKRSNLIMRGLEEGKIVKWTRNEQGEPVGLTIQLEVHDAISATGVTTAKLTKKEKEKGDD
jgi:hypothetical protein